jgi:hypothetical protein
LSASSVAAFVSTWGGRCDAATSSASGGEQAVLIKAASRWACGADGTEAASGSASGLMRWDR